ncbi:MAG: response regulator transcription factor [Chloroflexi bacterium]|nr:response regulator transcription factor [Chloroflexota bacterium]
MLVEDHALVRAGTRRILEQYPDLVVVGEASDGDEALHAMQRLQPDVALIDIRIPRLTGIDVVRAMNAVSPGTKAIMLTAYEDDDYLLAAMDAGALGYLLKTAEPDELADAIRTVRLGEPVLAPAIATKVARLWGRHGGTKRHLAEQLTPREREVLELMVKGLRNKAIADRLVVSVRTVEGHVAAILAKLSVSSRIEAVLQALSSGLVSVDEGDTA